MFGGKVSDNTVNGNGGGVYNVWPSDFSLSDGVISNNRAIHGGGVCNSGGTFSMSGGEVVNNIADKEWLGVQYG
ncbi:MAG: hypothetical protein LBC12_02375 [Nitrososphaerota archaeon]|jgi:hypothetical protein|nr:hypothetical protein [Nitrososphaerota archaeon]